MLNTGCDALDSEGQAAGFPERRDETKFIKPEDFLLIEQSPWEANSHSRDQNISLNLHDPILHDTVHTSPPLVPLLSQMNLLYNLKPCVYKINFNFILPFDPLALEMGI